MSTEQDKVNTETMQRFYDAIFANDWEGVEKVVSKNLTVYEAEGLPYGGEYRGIAGLQGLFAQVVGYWNDLSIEIKAVTSGGGYVVGVLQFSGASKATGKKVSMPIAEIAEFENGLIASIKPIYWDTKTISEAIGA